MLTYFFSFLAGILYAWGFPVKSFFFFFLFPIIGFIILHIQINNLCKTTITKKKAILKLIAHLISFNLGFFVLGFYWLITLFKNFGHMTSPTAEIFATLSSFFLTPQFFVFYLIFIQIKKLKNNKYKQYKKQLKDIISHPITLSLTITTLERITPQQFPVHIGHSWMQISPFLYLATIFSYSIFSFISYMIAFNVVLWIQKKEVSRLSFLILITLLSINFTHPLKRKSYTRDSKHDSQNNSKTKKLKIRIVQANIENDLKINSENNEAESLGEVAKIFTNLSTKDAKNLDLIIWPETALPDLLNTPQIRRQQSDTTELIPEIVKKVTSKANSYLLTGGYDSNTKNTSNLSLFETIYNSIFLFNQDGKLKNSYNKQILLNFGETLPFGPLNKYFQNINPDISFFAKGMKQPLFKLKGIKIALAICYEVLYPSFFSKYFRHKKADLIINISNDSWYGDTSEPFQHLFLARWRSVEFQTPIIRATNTGITAIIYSDGSYLQLMPQNKSTYKDITLHF